MSLIDLLQYERDGVFFDTNEFAQTIGYTPFGGQPTTIVAASVQVHETGAITAQDDGTFQVKSASLVLRQQDGNFGIGDVFSFPIQPRSPDVLNWLFRPGSSETNISGTQYVECVQIVPVEKGGNYRKQRT
jgi:hypothetical protein